MKAIGYLIFRDICHVPFYPQHRKTYSMNIGNRAKKSSKKVRSRETTVGKLTQGLNVLERYGRRQNLRLNNVPLSDVSKCEETVLTILNNALPVDAVSLTPRDTDRYHPIGKVNKMINRQVIIRFASYKANAKVRRGRNQHSLAFQIPPASKDVYKYSFFPQTGMTSLNPLFLPLKCQMIAYLSSPLL